MSPAPIRRRRFLGRSRFVVISAAFLSVACASLWAKLTSSRDRIKSPHARHIEAKVDCLTCHEEIFEAAALTERHLPKEKKCLECHREEKEKGNCGYCHTRPAEPESYAPRGRTLVMSHQKHLELEEVQEDCRKCHLELPEPDRAILPPPMDRCRGCHRHQEEYAGGECAACHLDLGRFPLRPVSVYSHRLDYGRNHRQDARSRTAACATCHEQAFCKDCHSQTVAARVEELLPGRVDRAFIHRGDYEGRHSVEARADGALCQRCHGLSFCHGCHTARGLTPEGARPLNPHPSGFGDPASASFHGPAARRDIVRCASCHEQGAASNCVDCHRVGGIGGNPHPASWLLRHDKEEIQRNAMCLSCHP
ncbi:MAG: cytochrome c3 family protein [Myxococcales bacterium]|nr:cytochrome c3 family protein [Myxococcales bacterium]